ncbi:bifunctional metallophosphatase/5'-nucleotidase [Allosphingosinicella sp.]|uniref:bifunctional metallophosphatase/5'-nucleotidase n=1 Tax=Allosphingosinicella sp. TaxID=2823234 RepID=UPI002EE55163
MAETRTKLAAGLLALLLAGCATTEETRPAASPVSVKIIAFNDFHGNLQPPGQSVAAAGQGGATVRVPAGGAAYLASAIERLRSSNANNAVVSAGDMIGASPLVSALFLDEPTIHAMNLIRVDFNAVGNHEFDRGRAELLRMQNGGCEQHTAREPCRLDRDFAGARFRFLAANVVTETGETLFPAYGIRSYGSGAGEVRVAFIGMTLRETPTLVTPAGVAGLTFRDEAETVNALIPRLRAEGADAIVVLIHQGLSTNVGYNDPSCGGIEGDLLPVLARLDPEVDVVVSGHTHNAYVCDYARIDPSRPFLVTSAGRYGTLVTDVTLDIDPASGVVSRRAENVIVQSEPQPNAPLSERYPAFPPNAAVQALVARYSVAAAPLASRVVGRLSGDALREALPSGESVLGDLIADAQLAATAPSQAGGAQIAFMNSGGVRADLRREPDSTVTYGRIFTSQPFGNILVVKSFTGRQIRQALEQQFSTGPDGRGATRIMLYPSRGFTFAYDLTRPQGQRIVDMRLNGQPIRDDAIYRVTINSFLSTGGDAFTVFRDGTEALGGPLDLDALEAYFQSADPLTPPAADRIRNVTPQ